MANIIDYVKEYGKFDFSQEPFNEVDSLVLCQLVYLNFEKFVPGWTENGQPVNIQSIYRQPDRERILDDYWYRENNIELFTAMTQSVRYGSLGMNYYVNIINEEDETQFSAMTYLLGGGSVYIAYRGTDANMVGWKEDCNLAFSKPIHSQYLSVEYMNRVSKYLTGGFLAGGHSKGGNLAVYAAMNCSNDVRERIIHVYNHDGPGFRPEIRKQGNYEAVRDRISKYIPKSSIIGMILEDHTDYEVVESKGVGLFQHNAYSWKVREGSFIRAKNMTEVRMVRDAAVNEWILSLTEEEIHTFVDTLYEVVCASEAKNVFQFGTDIKKSVQNVVEAAKEVDDSTKKMIQGILRALFEIMGERTTAELMEKSREFRDDIKKYINTKK